MILQSLDALYGRLRDDADYQIALPGFSLQKISFKVVLRPDGQLFDLQDLHLAANGKRVARNLIVPGGGKPSGAVTEASVHKKVLPLRNDLPFLAGGRAEEVADPQTGVPARRLVPAHLEFGAFKSFHLALKEMIHDPGFQTVCRFLEIWDPENVTEHPEWAELADGQGVFQILGEDRYVHDSPAFRSWWESCHGGKGVAAGEIAQCLITGATGPSARIHPPVKGVRGAQPTGAALVGFNDAAYESYGKKQSRNAPVSEEAAFRYTTALNALLAGPMRSKHRIVVGDATVVFWTERPTLTEDIFAAFAASGSVPLEPTEHQDAALLEKLKAFLTALRKGREAYAELEDDPDHVPFFLLGLAPNAARISVRFFHRGTLSELLGNLRAHHDDVRIQPQPAAGSRRGDPEFPPVWLLLAQTARDTSEVPPVLAGPLLRSIVTGVPYPEGLYSAVIRRIHADRTINYARSCVIKGYLRRNRSKELAMTLEPDRPDPAYRLGRLFAALEKTQIDALGSGLTATVRDRFYSSASATPRSVFPRLLRTYQHHLAKLEGGHKVNREKLVQEILDPLADFPAHLDLPGQGLFALGYYHQTRSFYAKKEATEKPDSHETEMEAP
jgi:CRISPR-associated protein Csd1